MLEMLWSILPFFNAGLVASVFARFTGMNMSMCTVLTLLYLGATPIEAVVAMLLFNVFTFFTIYSQQHLMRPKDFRFFPGIKIVIPVLLMIAITAVSPFLGIVFFVAVFLMEIFAKLYGDMSKKNRPSRNELVTMCAIGTVSLAVGLVLLQFIPKEWYFAFDGFIILLYCLLVWRSNDRNAFSNSWDRILYGTTFFTGLTGLDGSDWLGAMRRNKESLLSRCYPIVINTSMIFGLIITYFFYHYFSLGALFTSIGAALGIRFFGLYTHGTRGKFSYLALGITVLTVLIFMLIQPDPTGFPHLSQDLEQDTFRW